MENGVRKFKEFFPDIYIKEKQGGGWATLLYTSIVLFEVCMYNLEQVFL